jgi:arginyl-tRNA synthetase
VTPAQLSDAVCRFARDLGVAGVPARAQLRPRGEREWGTGIALRLAGPAGLPAAEIARGLRERLAGAAGVRAVEIDGRGFVNIRLGEETDAELLREILSAPRPPELPEDPARDAARWAAAAGGVDPLVQREENPLFRVRYAHARGRALERGGRALGVTPEPGAAVLPHRAERALLTALGEQVESVRRLVAVADAFLEVERVRPALPVGDEKPGAAHRARLALAQAAGAVLAGGLYRLGISAPEYV